ncbi:class I SAM-dependent methyltransferase [Peribacillus frigoritolerans]|uniref:class I SAM-dependent methyltransferase n=1 Tax=Peribacillus frigoritolerans TaxID=450367 RepID=UPI0010596724|nr:class I SAM-dependent methyltransferase [Peribacillus frigoritolerans]TDL82460.1 class I SAM-dependent methyltransferase [Peribacillus frigoritolerans]
MQEKKSHYNFEEYDDPSLYDGENESYTSDIPLLLKWASLTKGAIIDIACGTGRATIPLARQGHHIIGVDVHKGMLDEARRKFSDLHLEIDWVQQDCMDLNLKIRADFIYTVGNSFQHFLTNEEQDKLLDSVSRHLNSDGIFIFGTRFPGAEELVSTGTEEFWQTYEDAESKLQVDVFCISSYDPISQIQHNTTIRKYKNEAGEEVKEKKTEISLRYVFPREMERLLSMNGFKVLNVYGDWNENPLTGESKEMVYVCQKAGGNQ